MDVCSPAKTIRPAGRWSRPQYFVTCPGRKAAYDPPVQRSRSHASSQASPVSAPLMPGATRFELGERVADERGRSRGVGGGRRQRARGGPAGEERQQAGADLRALGQGAVPGLEGRVVGEQVPRPAAERGRALLQPEQELALVPMPRSAISSAG